VDQVWPRLAQDPAQAEDRGEVGVVAHRHDAHAQPAAARLRLAGASRRTHQQRVVAAGAQPLQQQEDLALAAPEAALGVDVDDAERCARLSPRPS